MSYRLFIAIYVVTLLINTPLSGQDSVPNKISSLPSGFLNTIDRKAAFLDNKISTTSEKYLQRLANCEARLKKKLQKIDPGAANALFANAETSYEQLKTTLTHSTVNSTARGEYLPYFDSLKTSLSFLQQNSNLLAGPGINPEKIKNTLASVKQLQSRLQDAEQVKQFIRQRKQQIKEMLNKYTQLPKSISKEYARFNKEIYYYSQQIREYKELLNDPSKLEQKTLAMLNKLPAFQEFLKEHSELAGLFRIPGNYGSSQSLAGLQTRVQVQQLIQSQVAGQAGAQQILQQNLQAAQAQLNQLKGKLNKLGGGSSDMEMPDLPAGQAGFKPNNQKTKSFWKRLEYGTNLQSTKSNYFFPTTTDIGLSVGYKLNDKSVIGICASYKMGWGKDIRHINITHEGIGVRSFIDVKLKGSFYASGGFEYNYQQPFNSLTLINSFDKWQQSGLAGISKVVSLKSKLFKKTKVQLLWDFLSYRQIPRTQAIKFRVGYNF